MTSCDGNVACRAAVIGLGLIGGSFAAALRAYRPAWTIVGHDDDRGAASRARDHGLVHETTTQLADALSTADVIVLAAPVGAILDTIERLPAIVSGDARLIDVGSTKTLIVRAMETLPDRIQAVGGHPMTGSLTSGTSGPGAQLFEGRRFVLTPTPRTRPETLDWARSLVGAFKARVLVMDAAEHDAAVALVSHLPYLLPVPLLEAYEEAGDTTKALVAGGFRSRLQDTGSNLPMWHDVLRTNRQAIREALRAYRGQLDRLESVLADGSDAELREMLARAAKSVDAVMRSGRDGVE